jgi:hypothetical protein
VDRLKPIEPPAAPERPPLVVPIIRIRDFSTPVKQKVRRRVAFIEDADGSGKLEEIEDVSDPEELWKDSIVEGLGV